MNEAEKALLRIDGAVRALRATGAPTDDARHDALLLELQEMFEEIKEAGATARALPPNELLDFQAHVLDVQSNITELMRELDERHRGERP